MIKHLPNFITCCHLICGCLGLVAVFDGELEWAAYMIWLGAFFDFIDGFVARLFKVSSEIGKQLDSLCDMVTFGVLPGMMMLQLLKLGITENFLDFNTPLPEVHVEYIAFLIPVFSALRLAKFNIDTRQSIDFIGLPTPANAIFLSSFPMILRHDDFKISSLLFDYRVLIFLTIVFSLLLVSEIKLFSLKFKDYSFKNNKIKIIFLLTSIILVVIFRFSGIPLIVILYITLSLVKNYLTPKT